LAITIQLSFKGQDYSVDVTNNITLLGELIINEVKKQIRIMDLVGDDVGAGSYLQRWFSSVDSDGLTVESGVDYSTYLEFGTYAFFTGLDGKFPLKAKGAKSLKKKDLPPSIRKALKKGMVPFAPVRRVLYNESIMNRLVKQAFASGI
jgi:hypothetical protein